MANYSVSNEWKSLSQIIGNEYDNEKAYRIHNNCENPAKLCVTEDVNTTGSVYPQYSDIYVEAGLNPKIKVTSNFGLNNNYSIEIHEVTE